MSSRYAKIFLFVCLFFFSLMFFCTLPSFFMFLYFTFNATRIQKAGFLKAGSGLRSSHFGDPRGYFQKTAPLISPILFPISKNKLPLQQSQTRQLNFALVEKQNCDISLYGQHQTTIRDFCFWYTPQSPHHSACNLHSFCWPVLPDLRCRTSRFLIFSYKNHYDNFSYLLPCARKAKSLIVWNCKISSSAWSQWVATKLADLSSVFWLITWNLVYTKEIDRLIFLVLYIIIRV